MSLDIQKSLEIIENMENYLSKHRPPEEMRAESDLGYEINGQSIIIFEISPIWNDPSRSQQLPIAKTTFVIKENHWKVFWMRGNLKWYPYGPKPIVKTLSDFLKLVEKDDHACFWG